ncbi:hypothetical protein CEXT_546641 [Caerostris extrusa]|uniref:Uncharacterized protein n=1 Tax=Caerostris extrusa TaxID=172846 RepID=A0AAV4XYN6_CAEEX|nr:hypothetical protein CEXT_546641 [Caerostris extrusa]
MEEDASVASTKGPTATTSAAVASGSSSITKEFRSKWLKEIGRSIEESVEIVIQYYFQSERIERDLYNALQAIENRKTTTDTESDNQFSEQLLEEGYLKESQKFIRTLKLLIRTTLMLHKRRSIGSLFSQEDSKGCQESKTEAVSQER